MAISAKVEKSKSAEIRRSYGAEEVVVVGGGVVGAATASALDELGHRVRVVDTSPARRTELANRGFSVAGEIATLEGAIVLMCLPTPAGQAGYDLSALRAASANVGRAMSGHKSETIVAVRSTVAPGTTVDVVAAEVEAASGLTAGNGFHVASAPEFLREATAIEDASNPWMTVLGCVDGESLNRLAALFKPLGGQMRLFDDPASAEAVKIIHNCFNATKISFFNEVSAICEAIGLDVQAVAEVVVRSAEAQRNPDYGTVGGRPFGGACLPKDLNGLIEFAQRVDVQPTLLGAVRSVNLSFSTGS